MSLANLLGLGGMSADVLVCERSLPDESSSPTAVVHFLITSLSVDSSTSSPAPTGDFDLDNRLEDGLLGCFVDPKVTKLLQTGVERGRVPDDAGWLGVGA